MSQFKILLGMQEAKVANLINLAIQNELEADIVVVRSTDEVLKALEWEADYDLVVADYPGLSEDIAVCALSHAKPLTFALCFDHADRDTSHFKSHTILKWVNRKAVVHEISQVVKSFRGSLAGPEDEAQMIRVPTQLLLEMVPLASDIYVRLSKTKFVKMFNAGDRFDETDDKRIRVQKDIQYLYVPKTTAQEITSRFFKELENLVKGPIESPEKFMDRLSDAHEVVKHFVVKFGPSEEVQAMVKQTVDISIKAFEKIPKMRGVLAKLRTDPKRYLSSHSIQMGRLACHISGGMDWSSETTYQKLMMAAFLHDIVFDNDRLAACRNLQEVEQAEPPFTPAEINLYKTHPTLISEMVKKYREIPADIDLIVGQHHERPDGTGFPRGLNSLRISPLAAVFIVAHDLLNEIFRDRENFQLKNFLEWAEIEYQGTNFKKALQALKRVESIHEE